jgi:hypothetical protein
MLLYVVPTLTALAVLGGGCWKSPPVQEPSIGSGLRPPSGGGSNSGSLPHSSPQSQPQSLPQSQPLVQSDGAPRADVSSVSGGELVKRARSASDSALTDLAALEKTPSSAALGRACGKLGELEAYLVALSYLLDEGLVPFSPLLARGEGGASGQAQQAEEPGVSSGTNTKKHADPRQWVSTAASLAPLCVRRGSSSDDFADDVAMARANVVTVQGVLAAFR